ASAWLPVLSGLARCPALDRPDRHRAALDWLVRHATRAAEDDTGRKRDPETERAEGAANGLGLAEVDRVAGQPVLAARSLVRVGAALDQPDRENAFGWWMWLDCSSRIGPEAAILRPPAELGRMAEGLTEYPLLGASILITLAFWWLSEQG